MISKVFVKDKCWGKGQCKEMNSDLKRTQLDCPVNSILIFKEYMHKLANYQWQRFTLDCMIWEYFIKHTCVDVEINKPYN